MTGLPCCYDPDLLNWTSQIPLHHSGLGIKSGEWFKPSFQTLLTRRLTWRAGKHEDPCPSLVVMKLDPRISVLNKLPGDDDSAGREPQLEYHRFSVAPGMEKRDCTGNQILSSLVPVFVQCDNTEKQLFCILL